MNEKEKEESNKRIVGYANKMYFHFIEMFKDEEHKHYIDVDNANADEFLTAFVMAMGNFYNNTTMRHFDALELVGEYNRITVEHLMKYGKIAEREEEG